MRKYIINGIQPLSAKEYIETMGPSYKMYINENITKPTTKLFSFIKKEKTKKKNIRHPE